MGNHPNGPSYVYEFYNADGSCLYVGCCSDFARRLRWHEREQSWFPEVVRVQITVWSDVETGLGVETALIQSLNPDHNRALTDHNTPARLPCRRCHRGTHHECLGTNRDGDPCRCGVCARAAA